MHPLLAMVLAAAALLQWASVTLLGWTQDGAAVAWEGKAWSLEKPDGVLPCERVFLIVGDPEGRTLRAYRRSSRVPMEEVTWRDEATDSLWEAAAPEAEAAAWLAAHPLVPAAAPRPLGARLEAKGPRQKLVLRTTLRGKDCPAATLSATLGSLTAPVAQDRCPEDATPHPRLTSRVQVAWSPDGTRAALAWNTTRAAGDDEIQQGRFVLVSRRALCRVDLLDGGAAPDSAAARLTRAGFPVGKCGTAAAPAVATTVFYAPGFRAEAREIAALLGAKSVRALRARSESPLRVVIAARR